uniref:Uncharacterized protein n=2 Tax=Meloidogyne TaxID=189290 RepID=A0A6V7WSU2_MELEN|nr:unnamed protein product [Meloidogyne enterolobii]
MRKHSVSAQLTRTARRFSTVIAPQLTKLEPVPTLQKHQKVTIRIADIQKLNEAIKQYVLHGGRLFDPVEFEIRAEDTDSNGNGRDQILLTAQFYTEEIVLFEGNKRLLSISLSDPVGESDLLNRFKTNGSSLDSNSPVLAKVRHPISGIKMFEVVQSQKRPQRWQITGAMDELNKCEVEAHSNVWRQMLSACGFVFAAEWWSIQNEGLRVAEIFPQKAVCEENSLRLQWSEQASNELRLLALCFGLVQTVREAFPSLLHIMKEARQRKMQIHRPSIVPGSP